MHKVQLIVYPNPLKDLHMNTHRLLAAVAVALVAAPAAYAQTEIELQQFGAGQASVISRAELRAEVLQAQAAGALVIPGEVLAAAVPARHAVTVPATRAAAQAQARLQARTVTEKDLGRIGAGF
jgi:hypothetical protein